MDVITRKAAIERGLTMYFTGKACPHGHVAPRHVSSKSCAECAKANGRRHYEANRETYIERARAFYKANPGPARQRSAEWRGKNIEAARERESRYRSDNRMALAIYNKLWKLANHSRAKLLWRSKESRRRARKNAAGGGYTADDLRVIFALQRGRCACCGKKLGDDYHADHIEPLARGGSNHRHNIQLTCPPCNLEKHASDPIEHAQKKLGRLL